MHKMLLLSYFLLQSSVLGLRINTEVFFNEIERNWTTINQGLHLADSTKSLTSDHFTALRGGCQLSLMQKILCFIFLGVILIMAVFVLKKLCKSGDNGAYDAKGFYQYIDLSKSQFQVEEMAVSSEEMLRAYRIRENMNELDEAYSCTSMSDQSQKALAF